MTFPNGQTAEYAYHPFVRDQLLERITHRLPGGALLSRFDYSYSPLGQVTNWTQVQGGTIKSWSAAYDAANRLVRVDESGPGGAHLYQYDYDDADNRLVERSDATRRDAIFDGLNQLVLMSNSPVNSVGYAWDAENRLVTITNGSRRTEFSYDGWDRRTRMVELENGIVTSERRFLWCGTDLCEERDAAGGVVLKRYFNHGFQARPGSDVPPGNYFYTLDHLRSVRDVTDLDGALQAQAGYTPFGQRQLSVGGVMPDHGFTGHYEHSSSVLNLALYRAYDSRLGRWIGRDPSGEQAGLNLYAYVSNDPLNLMDPDGREGWVANFYSGIGGGLFTKGSGDGPKSAGFELGVGKGGATEWTPNEKPGVQGRFWWDSMATIFVEGGGTFGPFSGKVSLQSKERADCPGEFGGPEGNWQGCIGPFCYGSNGYSNKLKAKPRDPKGKPWDTVKEILGVSKWKVKGSGKAGVKVEIPLGDYSF
jgi:RHS repeat-associated protein